VDLSPGGVRDPTRSFRLDGRTAIVTGASSGLGARFGQTLAAAGARVVLAARRVERIEELAERIGMEGGEASAVRCDVTVDDEVRDLVATTLERHGSVDVLANNAGIAPQEDAATETTESFRRVVAVNLTGAYCCAREVATVMAEGGGGSIVNTASISGLVAGDGADTPSYTATKGAIVNLTRELAVRWAGRGIRVNAIAPGYFPSEMTADELSSDEGLQFIAERTPLGRPGRIEELDGAMLFLASDTSSYVTGHTLVVDGGWTAR
jgi:NAD(P)-dependent dehydrogenase (short-subunit alcohol dehydrogenase family)